MRSTFRLLLPLLAVTMLIGACGGDDEQTAAGTKTPASGMEGMDHGASTPTGESTGAAVDRAFATMMIPHHESAIEMAEIARERGKSDFVKQLAEDIIKAQESEIETLKRVDAELADQGVEPGDLGMDMDMDMNMDMEELRTAEPFDEAFVDMMIPHHESAVDMAEAQLERGENEELKALAREIIKGQTKEIEEMREFRG